MTTASSPCRDRVPWPAPKCARHLKRSPSGPLAAPPGHARLRWAKDRASRSAPGRLPVAPGRLPLPDPAGSAGYPRVMSSQPVRILDLFAGAGGLTAGFHLASPRVRSVAAVEMDPQAAASYAATFEEADVFAGPIQEWIERVKISVDVDIIVGGPPCQGFSNLGKRDAEDERNLLWRQYAEVLRRVQPKYFVVENVPAFGKSKQYEAFFAATLPGGFLQEYSTLQTTGRPRRASAPSLSGTTGTLRPQASPRRLTRRRDPATCPRTGPSARRC